MTFIERLRQRLNLSADTPDEEVERLAEERLGEEPEGEEEQPPTTPGTEEGTDDPEAERAENAGLSAQVPEGMVLVDSDTLARLQAGAESGSRVEARLIAEEDNRILDEAVKAGKFAPSRREHWANLLKADREGTKQTLAALADDLIPVTERGKTNGTEASQSVTGYPPGLLPDVDRTKSRLEAEAKGTVKRSRVASDA